MSSIVDVPKLDFECKPSQHSLLRRENLHGFAALPDDLFLEILSCFPPAQVTAYVRSSVQRRIRREMLRSLSEVCQNMRRVFRPCLWQRVEVHIHPRCVSVPQKPTKDLAKELLRKLNIVTVQDPHLAQYVRIVDVEINSATFRPVFVELGRCFSLFPNLHTVKIVTKFSQESKTEKARTAAKRGFKKCIPFPQIRSAILSPSVYPLLAVCPNLESLTVVEALYPPMSIKGLTALQKVSAPVAAAKSISVEEDPLSNYTEGLITTIRSFPPNVRTWDFRLVHWHKWPSEWTELYKRAFLNIPLCDRQNLREVIFSSLGEQETFVLPDL